MRELLREALRRKNRGIIVLLLLCIFGAAFGLPSFAADFTMNIHGSYRHPLTGVIEDAGGEASEALGQSMVQRIMGDKAYYEEVGEERFLSVAFGMSDSISSFRFDVDTGNGFAETSSERFFDGDNVADYRIRTVSKETVIRARLFVEPMGRNVVFYIYGTDFVPGNATSFPSLISHAEETAAGGAEAVLPPAAENASEAVMPEGSYAEASASENGENPEAMPFLPLTADELLETAEGIVAGPETTRAYGASSAEQQEGGAAGEARLSLEEDFAGTIFLFVLAANLLSGILLIAFYFSLRFLYDSRKERRGRMAEGLKRSSILDLDAEALDAEDPELLEAFTDDYDFKADPEQAEDADSEAASKEDFWPEDEIELLSNEEAPLPEARTEHSAETGKQRGKKERRACGAG